MSANQIKHLPFQLRMMVHKRFKRETRRPCDRWVRINGEFRPYTIVDAFYEVKRSLLLKDIEKELALRQEKTNRMECFNTFDSQCNTADTNIRQLRALGVIVA